MFEHDVHFCYDDKNNTYGTCVINNKICLTYSIFNPDDKMVNRKIGREIVINRFNNKKYIEIDLKYINDELFKFDRIYIDFKKCYKAMYNFYDEVKPDCKYINKLFNDTSRSNIEYMFSLNVDPVYYHKLFVNFMSYEYLITSLINYIKLNNYHIQFDDKKTTEKILKKLKSQQFTI